MFFSRYEYQPIYIILYNFLRCRKGLTDSSFQDILLEEDYDGLKAVLDVEEVSKLAAQAIESYLMKTASIDFDRLLNDYMDDNLDYFMDLGMVVGSNYIEMSELNSDEMDLICYFHNNYIYKNTDLSFPYVNKNVTYEGLSKAERDSELFILNPILCALGDMYSLGTVDYDKGEFNLIERLEEGLDEHIKTLSPDIPSDICYDNDYDYCEEMDSDEATVQGLIYSVADDEITITDYVGIEDVLAIPKYIDSVPVRYIDGLSFLNIKKLIVVAELKEIKLGSLSDCSSLDEIIVLGSLGLVGQGVFANCRVPSITFAGATYLTVNNNPCYLLMRYQDCLSRYTVERGCKSIRAAAFFGSKVEAVSAPSVEYIGEKAFGQCKKLRSVRLNSWLKGIGEYAFYLCESLMSIKIDAKVLPQYLFYECKSLRNVAIGKGVEELGLYSLSYCSALKRVSIPGSVRKIGQVVFEYTPLEELEFEKDYYWIGKNDSGDRIVYKPEDLKDVRKNVQLFKKKDDYDFEVDSTTSIIENMTMAEALEYGFEIDDSVYGGYCIVDWTKDEKVCVIPKSIDNIDVKELGGYFSNNCGNKTKLEKLLILPTLAEISYGTFKGCKNLKEVTMPDGITKITEAFTECPKINKKEGGVTYVKINNNPYYYAATVDESETTIHFNLDTVILGQSLLRDHPNITTCFLPDVKILPRLCFSGAKKLQAIMIPDSVEKIENAAFENCTALQDVIFLGDSTREIENNCFRGCSALLFLQLPVYLRSISPYLLENCTNLTELEVPYYVNKIGKGAFRNCPLLTKLGLTSDCWVAENDDDRINLYDNYGAYDDRAATDFVCLSSESYSFTKCEEDEEFTAKAEQDRERKDSIVKRVEMIRTFKRNKIIAGC